MRKFLKKASGAVKKAMSKVGRITKKATKLDPSRAIVNKLAGKKLGGKLDMARSIMSKGPGIMRTAQVGSMLGGKAGRFQGKLEEEREKAKEYIPNQFRNSFGLETEMFKKGGPVKRAAGSPPKGEGNRRSSPRMEEALADLERSKGIKSEADLKKHLDSELEAFGKRARSGELGPGKKKSDLPLVDQYEVDRKMGRFSGSFKEYMDSKEAKQFKRGGVAVKHSDKTGRAMKKTDADAKGRAMPKAKGKMAGGMMTKGMMAGGMATKGYAAGGAAMPMVMKDGNKVPAFAADGKGKMAKGGMAGGMAKGGMAGGMSKVAAGKATRGYGAARRGS